MDKATTEEMNRQAQEEARKKAENVGTDPATKPAGEMDDSEPSDKDMNGYDKHADNDGNFHLKSLDDGTNVEAGSIMENQAREPAHQQHELTVEEDAPGYDQASALMTPRGNEHYDEGGSGAEVDAGKTHGEA